VAEACFGLPLQLIEPHLYRGNEAAARRSSTKEFVGEKPEDGLPKPFSTLIWPRRQWIGQHAAREGDVPLSNNPAGCCPDLLSRWRSRSIARTLEQDQRRIIVASAAVVAPDPAFAPVDAAPVLADPGRDPPTRPAPG
jgi:hypothetical protein